MTTSNENLQIMSDIYKLLGDLTRLRIMLICLDEQISVNDIAKKLNVSQSLVSHNLRLLKAARLVTSTRQNKQIFYQAADNHIRHILTDTLDHIKNCS